MVWGWRGRKFRLAKIWMVLFGYLEAQVAVVVHIYSFEVLISTIELQSMSFIGPLVMEIDYDVCLVAAGRTGAASEPISGDRVKSPINPLEINRN